jgi:NAD(P)-dependent dehydrogenase (short-subunit alcohol dehydrogenase family)
LIDRHEDLLYEAFPDLINRPDCFMAACTNLADLDQVNATVQRTIDHFGQVDIFINTVGAFRAGADIQETPISTWDFMMNLNARAVFNTTKALIPYMLERESGKIIHLAARPGLHGRAGMAAYSASKAAVIRIVESVSAEVKSKGINVNCILPGTIDTPENREAMPDADYKGWVEPASLADVILFLASDAGRDIHGAAIPVYGQS